jgi:hypothetical protein
MALAEPERYARRRGAANASSSVQAKCMDPENSHATWIT